jgi:hypothetical protein
MAAGFQIHRKVAEVMKDREGREEMDEAKHGAADAFPPNLLECKASPTLDCSITLFSSTDH